MESYREYIDALIEAETPDECKILATDALMVKAEATNAIADQMMALVRAKERHANRWPVGPMSIKEAMVIAIDRLNGDLSDSMLLRNKNL